MKTLNQLKSAILTVMTVLGLAFVMNSSGQTITPKMISPQNLAIGAAAVGLAGQEGDIFRRVLLWSLVLLLAMCVIVYLQSTAVLGWMVIG